MCLMTALQYLLSHMTSQQRTGHLSAARALPCQSQTICGPISPLVCAHRSKAGSPCTQATPHLSCKISNLAINVQVRVQSLDVDDLVAQCVLT